MREKQFENIIYKWLKSKGIYRLGEPKQKRNNTEIGYYTKRHGNMYVSNGLPDVQVVIGGKCFELELKNEVGKPSKLQEIIIKQINDSTGYARIVYPKDWEEVKSELEREIQRVTIIDEKKRD